MSEPYEVTGARTPLRGRVITVRVESVRMPDGTIVEREVVRYLGAVVIVALDGEDRVVVVNQYRHPVRRRLDELPAGLLDVDGEAPLAAARRELAEEAGLAARRWDVLLDLHTSPGFCDESVRVYLARELSESHPDGFSPEHEELTMTVRRVALDEAVRLARSGALTNAAAVAGVLAAALARADGWAGLRSADADWPTRTRYRAAGEAR